MIHLDSLAVTGDVYFGRNVTLRGTVISEHNCISIGITLAIIDYFHFILFRLVVAKEGQKIYVPDGCIIENSLYQFPFPSFHNPDELSRTYDRMSERYRQCSITPLSILYNYTDANSLQEF
jgi:hypothetical protein